MSKIVFFHMAHWQQLLGGAELQISYMVEYYSSLGDDIHFIYIDRNDKPVRSQKESLHKVNRIKFTGFFGKTWFLHIPQVLSRIRHIEPDVIVTITASSVAGACAKYAVQNNVKHVHFLASDDDVRALSPRLSLSKPLNFLEGMLYRQILNENTMVLSQNSFQERALLEKYGKDSGRWQTLSPEPDEIRFNKSTDTLHVVWVANLKKLKRPDLFIEIASNFKSRDDIHFTMIGADEEGCYRNLLDSSNHIDNFTYLGKLDNDDVNKVLCTAHVLVNTSDYEGFSNTFVQAWMREAIVISFNSNPDQILTDRRIGYLSGDVDGTIKILDKILCNRDELEIMSVRAREYAKKTHSLANLRLNGFWDA